MAELVSSADPYGAIYFYVSNDSGVHYYLNNSMSPQRWFCSLTDSYNYVDYAGVNEPYLNSSILVDGGGFMVLAEYYEKNPVGQFTRPGGVDGISVRIEYNVTPYLDYYTPTPANNTVIGSTLNVNVSSDWTLDNCKLEYNTNGTWVNKTMTLVNTTLCAVSVSPLPNATIFFRAWADSGSAENYTELRTVMSTGSCAYEGGNWNISFYDNCTINSNIVINESSNLTFTGIGYFQLNANISNWYRIVIDGTQLRLGRGARLVSAFILGIITEVSLPIP